MAWYNKRKKKFEVVSTEIPLSTMLRWYLYDTGLAPANSLAEGVGLNRVSEEGDVKEKEDSDLRLSGIFELMPFIDSISDMSVSTMLALQESKTNNEMSKEEIEASSVIYKAISMSSLIGALSIGLSLGILETATISSGRVDMDIDNE
jgi:hypothetical protein